MDFSEYLEWEVILGIRPEHIWLDDGPHAFRTELVLREIMGAETYLHLEFSGQKLVCHTPKMETPDGSVSVTFNAARILLFDKETEETIGI